MKRLLIPVDFSEESIAAIENGIQIANSIGLGITLIHVKKKKKYYMGFSTSSEEQYPDEVLKDQCENLLKQFKPKLRSGGTFNYILAHGSISHEILSEAHQDDIFAICTALQGNTSLRDYLVGSNAYRVLSGSKRPIFSIRKEMGLRNIKKILMPIDGSVNTRKKVPFVAEIAKITQAKITVCAISETAYEELNARVESYAKQTFNFLGKSGINVSMKEEYNVEIPRRLVELTAEEDIDLLAYNIDMIEGPIGMILSGSVRYILHHAQCPLLCIPLNN